MLLYKNISAECGKLHNKKIIGWFGNELLVASAIPRKNKILLSKKHGVNPLIYICGGCGKEHPGVIALPGRCNLVNPETGAITQYDVEITSNIVHPALCGDCEIRTIRQKSATLRCAKCKKQIAWLEPGTIEAPEGLEPFTIKAGTVYEAPACQECGGTGFVVSDLKEVVPEIPTEESGRFSASEENQSNVPKAEAEDGN